MPNCQSSLAVFPTDHSSHNAKVKCCDWAGPQPFYFCIIKWTITNLNAVPLIKFKHIYSLTWITLRAPSGRRTLSLSDCRTWYRGSRRRTYFRTTRIQRVWIAAYWSCFERSGAWCYFHVLSCRLSRGGGQIGWSRITWG